MTADPSRCVDGVPDAQCPRCGAWVPDHDGFGVLAHIKPAYRDGCGYCSHPSIDDGVCGICGQTVRLAADPSRCECGAPKPSILGHCSPECEVQALRAKLGTVERETAAKIAAYVRRHTGGADADRAAFAVLFQDIADDIEKGEWRKA
jgi:hypothetical protein